MPAVSEKQRKLFALAYAYKKGKISKNKVSDKVKKLANSVSLKTLKDFAKKDVKESNYMNFELFKELLFINRFILEDGMATTLNTPGMGNTTPATFNQSGSGDVFSGGFYDFNYIFKDGKDEDDEDDDLYVDIDSLDLDDIQF